MKEQAYWDQMELVARIVQAEAGNQGLKGKRLVACVILNRIESDMFPEMPIDVLSQKHQFTTWTDGSLEEQLVPDEETYEAVRLELEDRSDPNIFYFTAGKYNPSGRPAYKYKDHYFSYLK
jgi:N-acetylmuramoyl-L-alanine amidase